MEGCDRLCPQRYPKLGVPPSDVGCTNPVFEYFFTVRGPSSVADLDALASVVTFVVYNVTKGEVCLGLFCFLVMFGDILEVLF